MKKGHSHVASLFRHIKPGLQGHVVDPVKRASEIDGSALEFCV